MRAVPVSLDHAILGFLTAGDMTGYDLKTRCFEQDAAHYWTADQAQIYRTLDRLERRGLVSSALVAQRGKPDRNVYSLTRSGRDELDAWVAEYHPTPPLRDPLLIQLACASTAPETTTLTLLEQARADHQARLERLRRRAATSEHETRNDHSARARVTRMTYEAALARERATIDWLDDCIDEMNSVLEGGEDAQRRLFRSGE